MADIFSSRSGYVAVMPGQNVIPGRVHIDGFDPAAALVAGIDYDQATNQQFQTSLDGAIYLYVFGDQMGSVRVRGIAFPIVCGGAQEGILELLEFYEQQRASTQSDPIEVQVGSRGVIKGFLTAVSVRAEAVAEDPASFISTYVLTINALPKK